MAGGLDPGPSHVFPGISSFAVIGLIYVSMYLLDKLGDPKGDPLR